MEKLAVIHLLELAGYREGTGRSKTIMATLACQLIAYDAGYAGAPKGTNVKKWTKAFEYAILGYNNNNNDNGNNNNSNNNNTNNMTITNNSNSSGSLLTFQSLYARANPVPGNQSGTGLLDQLERQNPLVVSRSFRKALAGCCDVATMTVLAHVITKELQKDGVLLNDASIRKSMLWRWFVRKGGIERADTYRPLLTPERFGERVQWCQDKLNLPEHLRCRVCLAQ